MSVDLNAGEAVVKPSEGASIDPREFRKAIRRAGFTLRKIQVEMTGTVRQDGDALILEMPGAFHRAVLGGKSPLGALRESHPIGRRIRVEGVLHLPPEAKTASVDIVSWTLAAPP